MDVVGDDSPINIYLDAGGFIHAKGRTLGADDKVGVACALKLAKDLKQNVYPQTHGGLEITFTRDEETGMSGVEHAEFDKIQSKYILVCDADKLGQLQISGASYTNAKITVKGLKGGHSGIDIGDKTRLNAAKLIAELLAEFPGFIERSCVFGNCLYNFPSVLLGKFLGLLKSMNVLFQSHAGVNRLNSPEVTDLVGAAEDDTTLNLIIFVFFPVGFPIN
jgi:di/tripeptidase